jgi:hypothetical protein
MEKKKTEGVANLPGTTLGGLVKIGKGLMMRRITTEDVARWVHHSNAGRSGGGPS